MHTCAQPSLPNHDIIPLWFLPIPVCPEDSSTLGSSCRPNTARKL
jgi:hypothetical protein